MSTLSPEMLPETESGVEADIPLIGYFPDKAMPDAGITPDVLAAVTARDIASGRDAAMERAMGSQKA